MAFEEDHWAAAGGWTAPDPAGADRTLEERAGSSSQGASMSERSPADLGRADGWCAGEVGGGAGGAVGALANADAGGGRDVPEERVAGVDGDGAAFAGGELRPRRGADRGGCGGGGAVCAEPDEQRCGVGGVLGEADDFGERAEAGVEILEVGRVVGGAGADCWLTPSVERQRPPSLPR